MFELRRQATAMQRSDALKRSLEAAEIIQAQDATSAAEKAEEDGEDGMDAPAAKASKGNVGLDKTIAGNSIRTVTQKLQGLLDGLDTEFTEVKEKITKAWAKDAASLSGGPLETVQAIEKQVAEAKIIGHQALTDRVPAIEQQLAQVETKAQAKIVAADAVALLAAFKNNELYKTAKRELTSAKRQATMEEKRTMKELSVASTNCNAIL